MVTRDDVARLAKTSSAVVSYVVNGGPRNVSESTRQRVLDAVEQLGYRPNALARALRSASSRVLGLVVPDIANPFFGELALAIEKAAFQQGYALFLGNAMHDDEQQASYLQAFAEHQVQGLLLIGAAERGRGNLPPATKAALSAARIPLVFLDRLPGGIAGFALIADNKEGGYLATKHLLEHGHRGVGTITGPPDLSTAREREKGWARALREVGIDPKAQPVARAEFDRHEAYNVARELFRKRSRPSALFVHSDEQAIGVLHAAAAEAIRIPDDIAIASFDGIRESALTHPALTTVQQPVELAGQRAVQLVVDRINADGDGNGLRAKATETLPVTLTIRRSCGCGSSMPSPRRSPRKK
jgi:LacI family transcriptional regulator